MWYSPGTRWRLLCPSHSLSAGLSRRSSEQFYTAIFIYRKTTLAYTHIHALTHTHTHSFLQLATISYVLHCQLVLFRQPQSSRAGPTCSIPVFSPSSSSSVCSQDHLVLLLVARFWIIQHNNGPKDCLDQLCSWAAR